MQDDDDNEEMIIEAGRYLFAWIGLRGRKKPAKRFIGEKGTWKKTGSGD